MHVEPSEADGRKEKTQNQMFVIFGFVANGKQKIS